MRHLAPTVAVVSLAALAASPAEAARRDGRCRLPGDATVELRTRSAIVYARHRHSRFGEESVRIAGCLKSQGDRFLLAGFGDESDGRGELVHEVAAGRFVALAIEYGGRSGGSLTMTSFDLRTGKRARGLQVDYDDANPDRLRSFAVNTSGDLGWSIDRYRPGIVQADGSQAGAGYFGEVHAFDARGDVRFDSGPEGAFLDVRMRGRFVSWAVPGGTRVARQVVSD